MADDNKNPAGDTERTSILPQTGAQAADQTEVLPTHVSQAETAQMPPRHPAGNQQCVCWHAPGVRRGIFCRRPIG